MANQTDIERKTAAVILTLWNNGDCDKAALSSLRKSKTLSCANAAYPVILSRLNREWLSTNDKETKEEKAIYEAVRLYAMYQQGISDLTSAPGWNFAHQLYKFKQDNENRAKALDSRFHNLTGGSDFKTMAAQLEHLIMIVKQGKKAPKIDFPSLAQDLYDYQVSRAKMNAVRLRWGEEYY